MKYISHYGSPLGGILLAGDENGLSGLWFDGAKYFADGLKHDAKEAHLPAFDRAKLWLDIYFSGKEPNFTPPLNIDGTPFQKTVWQLLLQIPYGHTRTYGEIAAEAARKGGMEHMSAQAVGGAVGRNRISLIIPCHRVVGANGSLTGYAGGVDKKLELLKLEGIDTSSFHLPKRGMAL